MKFSTISILSTALTLLSTDLCAKVLTVSNNANSPGQYSDFASAQSNASPNDTIYLHGSPNVYGQIDVNKPLVIIGAGSLPNKNHNFPTKVHNLYLGYNSNFSSSASGSKIIGMEINHLMLQSNLTKNLAISNILITRNKIALLNLTSKYNQLMPHSNLTISNNILGSISEGTNDNININNSSITNNIIHGTITNIGNENNGSYIISNNIFFYNFSNVIGGLRSAVITNNIFYCPDFENNNLAYCSISNNLFYFPNATFSASKIIYGTNTGGNNIINQDPKFITFDDSYYVNSISHTIPTAGPFPDLKLKSNSPGKSYGTDGTDIGIYGGNSPYFEGTPANSRYRYFPMPGIPQVLDYNILNSSVPVNGTLNIEFKARKQD